MTGGNSRQWWIPSGLSVVLLSVLVVVAFLFSPTQLEEQSSGGFDVSALDFSRGTTVSLHGKWTGVVGELILSDTATGQELPVPGEYSPSDASLLTVWTTLEVNPNAPPTGIFLPGVNSSQRVFVAIDGGKPEVIAESGVVSDSILRTIPSYYRTVARIPAAKNSIRIFIHIANQHYPRLSIWDAPIVGDYENLVSRRHGRLLLDAMLMGVFLFLSLYFLRIFHGRENKLALVPFGLTCLLMSLRVFSTGPAADFFLANITMADFNFRWRLDYIGIVLAAPLYALHLASVFQIEWFRRVAIASIAFGGLAVMGVLTFDPAEFAQLLRPLEGFLLMIGFAIIGLTVDAVRQAHPQGRDYLWVNLSLIIAFFHDILLSFNLFASIQIAHYVFSGVLILLGNQLAHRFLNALMMSEDLSRTLQARVSKQTEALERRALESEALRKQAETGLNSLTKLAEQRMHFFQTISHELRTPLTLLLGPLERVHANYPQDLEVIAAQKNAKRLLRLVNQLLEFHQVQAGARLSVRPSRLHWITDGCIEQFQMVAELRQIRFQVQDRDDALSSWLRVDPDILDKVVTNLLSNAFKYLGEQDEGSEIIVMTEKVGPRVRISVIDNGVGMTKEEISRVFSPFKRGNHSLTRDVVGTGLGLSIAKTLTELMGGRIGVISMPDSGTTFWIEFDEIIPPARSIMAERSVSVLTRRGGIEAVLEKVLHERPDIKVYRNEIRNASMMVVLDWAALSTLDKREIYELSDEEIGPPLVIIVSPDARGELREIPENRIWCVVEEPVAQGELNNIFEECLFEQRDYHSIAAHEVVEYRNYYLTEQLERSLRLEQTDDDSRAGENHEGLRGRILVVDDHEDIRQFVCRVLEREGYVTSQASSFKHGLARASQDVPDLVITDWMMGELSGLDLIREMRQREETEGIPIILLTSRSDAESKAIGFESGADAYLTKPFVEAELNALVRNLLHLRQTERERGTQVRNQVMESVSIEVSARVERALQQLRHVSRAIRDRVDIGRELISGDSLDKSMISDLEVMLDNVHRSTFDIVGALDRVTRISEQLEHLSGRHAAPKQLVWVPGLLDDVMARVKSEDDKSELNLAIRYSGDADKSLYLQRTLFEICLERLLMMFKEVQSLDVPMNAIEISVGFEKFGAGSMSLGIKTSEALYKSLTVAFGGYVPPTNSDLDSVVLREALVGASWLEDAMHHQELTYDNGVFKFCIYCSPQEYEEDLSPGDDLFLDLDHRPDAEVVDLQAHRRGRYRS